MSVHVDLSHLNKVWEVSPLKMLGEEEARKILENVAKQVEPIMHKRRWKVTLVSEFCPSDPSLLGLNIGGGAEIRLRLRKHNQDWDFFPLESILDTMLHELCHNVYGPHNGDFYRLLDEIRAELTELMIKGIGASDRGFNLLLGRQLGGSQPRSRLRQNALGAAQNRAWQAGLMPSGPIRVGGDVSIRAALSPAQAAAMAANRRLHDDLWCGSKSGEQGNSGSSSTASHSMENVVAVMTWQCNACTLTNRPTALVCEACTTPREEEKGSKFKRPWSCKFCTMKNHVKLDRCRVCGEWRYSNGPLVSGYTPFSST
ncbi:hypothetical protein V2J09_004577 [Rumex salicifolius]